MVHQNYEHFKRLVLDSPDSEAEYIKGFDFEWGYAYKLKVKETKIGPLSDGTNFEYSLVKIVKKEKVSDTINFLLVIDPLVRYTKLDEDGIENFSLGVAFIVFNLLYKSALNPGCSCMEIRLAWVLKISLEPALS